jgi:hypothetical protein
VVEDVSEAHPEQIRVRLDWSAAANAVTQHVNQAIAGIGPPLSNGLPDGIYVTFGSVPPPVLLDDDPEARADAIAKLKAEGTKVNVAAQFHITRQMVDDIIHVLRITADRYDIAVQQASASRHAEGE